jgi:hypothetical protein
MARRSRGDPGGALRSEGRPPVRRPRWIWLTAGLAFLGLLAGVNLLLDREDTSPEEEAASSTPTTHSAEYEALSTCVLDEVGPWIDRLLEGSAHPVDVAYEFGRQDPRYKLIVTLWSSHAGRALEVGRVHAASELGADISNGCRRLLGQPEFGEPGAVEDTEYADEGASSPAETTPPSATTSANLGGSSGLDDAANLLDRLFDAWKRGDRQAARAIASENAVTALFARDGAGRDAVLKGCDGAAGGVGCTVFVEPYGDFTIELTDLDGRGLIVAVIYAPE